MTKPGSNPFIRFLVTCKKTFTNMMILSREYGQAKSIYTRKAVGKDGKPVPWFTYPALQYISQFDLSRKKIFEYGAGNSSIYWCNRGANVVSVEGDVEWYHYVSKYQSERFAVILAREKNEYIHSIQDKGMFDVIVIDGRYRYECSTFSPQYLNEDGFLILDNSEWYPETASKLRQMGFFQIDFSGFGPINSYCWTTSIFIRTDNGLQENFQNPLPIGGIECSGDKND